jgi:hypothetical protein
MQLVRYSIKTGLIALGVPVMQPENYSRRKEKCHSIIDLAWIPPRLVTGVAGVRELQSLLGAAASAL